jgi:hypothetical protein
MLLAGSTLAAKPGVWPLALAKGTRVVTKIPLKAIAFEKMSVWTGAQSFTINIEKSVTGYTVGGFPDWKNMGWASQYVLFVNKAERKGGYLQVELDDENGNHFKLRFMSSVTDVNAALNELVFAGTFEEFVASDYYQKELAGRFLPKMFTGPLAAIPVDKQLKFFQAVRYDLSAIEGETYKSKFYLVMRFNPGTPTYNSNMLNAPTRVATVVQQKLLTVLKALHEQLADEAPEINGIKVEWKILHRNFVTEPDTAAPAIDELFVYSAREELAKFSNDDITNQQLIDNSIILLNGNRVAVSLTQ